jgi:hypothetical protein
MGWPPQENIERTDRMLVFMGPVSNVAYRHQMFGFTLSVSLAGRGEKQGKTAELLNWAGGSVGSIGFSGADDLSNLVDDYVKCCHVRGLPTGSVCMAYVDWRGKHTCRVDRVFPCRVYIDSNRHDSRI